jgi:predicted nucleic-acid-binding protein
MIGIDTNLLLRLWLNDDPAQNKRIDALLATLGGMPGSLLVTDVVLAEAVWTLKSAFEQDRSAQLIAVRSLL